MGPETTAHADVRVGRTLEQVTPSFEQPRRPRPGAPNVVMIVLDDLGFAELGCYGSQIATPSIDRLAEYGLRYNNFHVTALCSPTRACLLTGRNHHAVGMGFLTNFPLRSAGYDARIPRSAGALPRLLRDAGYNTVAVGKWHLTPPSEMGPAGPFRRWPLGLGFERYYGFLDGAGSQWTPRLVRDNGFVDPPRSPEQGYHLTEDLADQAIRLVQDQHQAAPDKPFFLYFAPWATHTPHQVPSEWIEQYRGRFDHGWDEARQRAFLRQRKLGVVPKEATFTERPTWVSAWDPLPNKARRVYARQMEVYAGYLTHADAQIGRLLEFLARIEAVDNTIIMLLSDNGAAAGGPHGRLNPDVQDVETMYDRIDDFGGFRSKGGYAWGWSWAGNTPFRLWKHHTWLGGVRVPLIVNWPAGIAGKHHGQVRTQFSHAIDLMPTILEATGVDVPDVLDGVTQQRIDGQSLLATFTDPDCPAPRDTQYFELQGSRALYHGGWKATTDHVPSHERGLVEGSHDFDTDEWSLFNLTEDFSEAHDLADEYPDRLRHMMELWWYEAGRHQVLPLDDRLFERRAGNEYLMDVRS